MDYDGGYHLLFSFPELVEELVRGFIHEPWVDHVDFSSLQRINSIYHTEWMKRREGDIVYRVRLFSGKEIFFYLLLEFQSQDDEWMAVRVLTYTALLYDHLIRENQLTTDRKIPPVFPVVLYNGNTPWTARQSTRDIINLPEDSSMWKWQPCINYYLIQENQYANIDPHNLVEYLFKIENCRYINELSDLIGALTDKLAPYQPAIRRALSEFIKHFLKTIPGLKLDQVSDISEVHNVLVSHTIELEENLKTKLKQEGRKEGRKEGEAILFIKQLQKRFQSVPLWATEKINDADAETIERWGLRLLDASTLDDIFD